MVVHISAPCTPQTDRRTDTRLRLVGTTEQGLVSKSQQQKQNVTRIKSEFVYTRGKFKTRPSQARGDGPRRFYERQGALEGRNSLRRGRRTTRPQGSNFLPGADLT